MTNLCCDVLKHLEGKTLATAESCTGGGIGAALTAIPGSSAVYKGGIISYTNWVKQNLLNVDEGLLETLGAVSAPVARAMAVGARKALQADIAVSVTGLAGPDGDGVHRCHGGGLGGGKDTAVDAAQDDERHQQRRHRVHRSLRHDPAPLPFGHLP